MWWFALILLANSSIPGSWLYGSLAVPISGANVTALDILLFGAFPFAMLMGRGSRDPAPAHRAFRVCLTLFVLAFAAGALLGIPNFQDPTERWYIWAARGFLTVPVAMTMAHRILRNGANVRAIVWLLFVSSLSSALLSVVTAAQASLQLGQQGGTLDVLRGAALDVPGDSGVLAACIIIYCVVSRVRLAGAAILAPAFLTAAMGMFLTPHRSSWLMFFATCLFAGLFVWRTHYGRKFVVGSFISVGLLVTIVCGVMLVQSRSERDFVGWIERRIQSLLPDEEATGGRAWDSRMSGLQYDLEVWTAHPAGGGFGVHERYAVENGSPNISLRHTPWTSTLAETGPLGVAAFAALMFSMLVLGLRLARSGPDRWVMMLGAAASCMAVFNFLNGCFTLSWNVPRAALMLGLMAGLLLRCRALAAAQEQADPAAWAPAQPAAASPAAAYD